MIGRWQTVSSPNEIPDFILPQTQTPLDDEPSGNLLPKLLVLPYNTLPQTLKRAALDLKETIVRETWGSTSVNSVVSDYTLYTGVLGMAFLLFKSYKVTNNKKDLTLCAHIVKACHSASPASSSVTFLCGQADVLALGAVVAQHIDDARLCDHYLTEFKGIKLNNKDLPNELLYGRAGYLWACVFLNKNLGNNTITSSQMRAVTDEIIKSVRQMSTGKCQLMYEWYGIKYWGAAHGLAGIMHVLLHMDLTADELEDVKGTLCYMINNCFPTGNYPSSDGSVSDRLVHWCHGAPGVAHTLAKAAKVFGGGEFLEAAVDAGEVVWNRGLLNRVGVFHGISGNTYVFLSLYQLTGNAKFLFRAKAFASFLHDKGQILMSEGLMHGGDHPYSLFEGSGGMAYLFLDMTDPSEAKFPAYEF